MERNRQRSSLWSTCAVLLAVLLAYANSFGNGFHFDDAHTVIENPAIRSLGNLPRFFNDAATFSVLPANRTYRPMVSTSLALDYHFGRGYTPFWFHLSTTLEFLLLVWLVMQLAQATYARTEDSPAVTYVALSAAAWFGLHPVAAETVNYAIQRGDLFCTLGCVAALVIYVRRPSMRRTGIYLLPLAFSLLSKPPAAVFPLLLYAWVWYFESSRLNVPRWKHAAKEAFPALVVTACGLLLQSTMTPKSFAPTILNAADYRLTQPYVWLRYFGQLLLPFHLNIDSDLPAFTYINPQVVAGFAFLAILIAVTLVSARRPQLYPLAFSLVWFVLTQLPTSAYALSEVENDHRMFFSFAGLIPGLVWGIWIGLGRLLRARMHTRAVTRALAAGVVLLLCGFAYGTRVRNEVWHTDESLWRDDVEKSPHNGRGLMNYGLVLMAQGRYPEALQYFHRALEFTPNYPTLEINLGVAYGAMSDAVNAEKHFQRAVALSPSDDQAHAFYARWLMRQGRSSEAEAQAKLAHDANPARPLAFAQVSVPALDVATTINQSLLAYQRGNYGEAIAFAQKALIIDPRSAAAYNNIGASYAQQRKWDEAIEAERKAVELDPSLQLAKNNLAWALSEKGKADAAH